MALSTDVDSLIRSAFSTLTSAQLTELEGLIGESALLVSQLSTFVAHKGTIQFTAGTDSGSFDHLTNLIQMSVPQSTAVQSVADVFAGYDSNATATKTGNYDSEVSDIVGTLAHEIGHFENSIGPIYSMSGINPFFTLAPSAFTEPTIAADEFLSEGIAEYNNYEVAFDIAKSTNGADQISFTDGTVTSYADEASLLTAATWDASVTMLAQKTALSAPSTSPASTYLSLFWQNLTGGIQENVSNVDGVTITTAANGFATAMTFHHKDGSTSVLDLSQSDTVTDKVTASSGKYVFQIVDPNNYSAAIGGFAAGDTIDLDGVGTASGAVISGSVLSVQGISGGTVNLQLDPSIIYSGQVAMVAPDGNGGTDVTLGPAPTHTITFSEYPLGTENPVYTYPDNTVDVIGEIVVDSAQPASPAVAANTSYTGPVFIDFTTPVTHVAFDAGYFDALESTTITFIGPGGAVLKTFQNTDYGIVPYTEDDPGGISAINVVNTGYDPSGFSVDTVTFSGTVTAAAAAAATGTVSVSNTNVVQTPAAGQDLPPGAAAAATPAGLLYTFTVTRTGDTSGAASVGWAVTGTGSNPLVAANLPNGTFPLGSVNFVAGQSVQTFTVNIVGGFTPSNPMTFAVTLIAPSAGISIASASAPATTLPPPTISNTVAGQTTTGTTAIDPFAQVTIADPNANETETLTVTLSAAANGTLSNLGGGSYNAATGVFTDAGTAAAVTTDLDALVFTPAASAQPATSGFTIQVVDKDAAVATDATTSVLASPALVEPTIRGAVAGQTTTDGQTVAPFSGVTITDANASQTETLSVALSAPANGTLSNLGTGSYNATSGLYSVTGTAAAVTAALEALVFTPTAHQVAPGDSVTTGFTITDTDTAGATASDTTTSVVATAADVPGFTAFDTSSNLGLPSAVVPYTGPVAELENQYINITTDNLNIGAATPNWFIHSGAGTDGIIVDSGTNVLDGGTGSNFLTGGSGTDTFFVDDRGASADIWSTVNNFHAGDAATIWGVDPTNFTLDWEDGQGAGGFTGLTLHATAPSLPTASLTLVGFTQADMASGRLSVSFGTDPASGSNYMYVHANS